MSGDCTRVKWPGSREGQVDAEVAGSRGLDQIMIPIFARPWSIVTDPNLNGGSCLLRKIVCCIAHLVSMVGTHPDPNPEPNPEPCLGLLNALSPGPNSKSTQPSWMIHSPAKPSKPSKPVTFRITMLTLAPLRGQIRDGWPCG